MNDRLLSVAEAELAEAAKWPSGQVAKWHQEQVPGLGQQFLDEFEATMDRVTRFGAAIPRFTTAPASLRSPASC